jgi:hypothetical protein
MQSTRTAAYKVEPVEHASASEHTLSNIQKQKELQDMQDEKDAEGRKKESGVQSLQAAPKENATGPAKKTPPRAPRNLRVSSLDELSLSFTAEKEVMDVQYCVEHLLDLRSLVEKNDQLSKFSDFRAPDHKNTMPMKTAFTPEKLMFGKVDVLAKFYDPGLTMRDGEADPMNPPYFRISRELMGRVIHTLRREYISDDENTKMSKEFEEHMKEAEILLSKRFKEWSEQKAKGYTTANFQTWEAEHIHATLGASCGEH